MAKDLAKFMTGLETGTAGGGEANFGQGAVEELTGQAPTTFDEWATKNKSAWQ